MTISFDAADPAVKELVRTAILKQRAGYLNDVGLERHPKLSDSSPPKEPPAVPAVDSTPRRHEVVAWRHSGPIAVTYHPDKDTALAHARALPWAVYWKAFVMCGRDMVERFKIDPPAGYTAAQIAAVIGE